jgi:hypothetical protein
MHLDLGQQLCVLHSGCGVALYEEATQKVRTVLGKIYTQFRSSREQIGPAPGRSSNFSDSFAGLPGSLGNNIHHSSRPETMLQPEQSMHHAANSNSSGRRNLPRASHACQWCRAKKAKCNQQQPCSNCVKHSIDCEYSIRRRAGRKKSSYTQERVYRDTSERESDPTSPASNVTGHNRPNENTLLGQPQARAASGIHNL